MTPISVPDIWPPSLRVPEESSKTYPNCTQWGQCGETAPSSWFRTAWARCSENRLSVDVAGTEFPSGKSVNFEVCLAIPAPFTGVSGPPKSPQTKILKSWREILADRIWAGLLFGFVILLPPHPKSLFKAFFMEITLQG